MNMTTATTSGFATGGYISYPSSTSTIASIGPTTTISSLTDILRLNSERNSEALSKIDQHVDQLEEDIDYFNRTLEQQDEKIKSHENCINDNYTINAEQDRKIKALEDTVEFLKNYTNYLEGRIMALEDKANDKMS